MGGFLRRHSGIVPYLLLAPGILWLVVFYVCPAFQMFLTSFWTGTLETGFDVRAVDNCTNYTDALDQYSAAVLSGRILYGGGWRRCSTFLIAYPLAYTIAFRGGRYKNLLLFLVIAPFFTSFLLRTISWKIILGRHGHVLGPLKDARDPARTSSALLATPIAVSRASPTTSCRS